MDDQREAILFTEKKITITACLFGPLIIGSVQSFRSIHLPLGAKLRTERPPNGLRKIGKIEKDCCRPIWVTGPQQVIEIEL